MAAARACLLACLVAGATASLYLPFYLEGHHTVLLPNARRGYIEGQELRFHTTLRYRFQPPADIVESLAAEIDVRVYAHTDGFSCEGNVDDNTAYVASATNTGNYTTMDAWCGRCNATADRVIVQRATVTFPAPPASLGRFHVCYKHQLEYRGYELFVDPGLNRVDGEWTAVQLDPFDATIAAETYYYIPEPTVGQQAIIQLLTREAFGFEYSDTECIENAVCTTGDSLKIVPQGQPCTYETPISGDFASSLGYFGHHTIDGNASWTFPGLLGILEGATVGGVGAFGTQYANPFIQKWSASGRYADVNDLATGAMYPPPYGGESGGQHAYVYATLPDSIGMYDVCFVSTVHREALAAKYASGVPVNVSMRADDGDLITATSGEIRDGYDDDAGYEGPVTHTVTLSGTRCQVYFKELDIECGNASLVVAEAGYPLREVCGLGAADVKTRPPPLQLLGTEFSVTFTTSHGKNAAAGFVLSYVCGTDASIDLPTVLYAADTITALSGQIYPGYNDSTWPGPGSYVDTYPENLDQNVTVLGTNCSVEVVSITLGPTSAGCADSVTIFSDGAVSQTLCAGATAGVVYQLFNTHSFMVRFQSDAATLTEQEGGFVLRFTCHDTPELDWPTQQPVWRKLRRCVDPAACGSGATELSFLAAAEPVGWSMFDMTPDTWGQIVLDDSGQSLLSRAPVANIGDDAATVVTGAAAPAPRADNTSYWSPQGGDFVKIIDADEFVRNQSEGRALSSVASTTYGSYASRGCWYEGTHTAPYASAHAGFVDRADSVVGKYPIGATDLMDDPTLAAADRADDATGQPSAFSYLYVPKAGTSWNVCYRRACTAGRTGSPDACAGHTGMRVLPYHYSARGSVPAKWLHLETDYTPGVGANASHPFTPGAYTLTQSPAQYPPSVTWYANDTRSGTVGPVVVERTSLTTGLVDARPLNFVRTYPAVSGAANATDAYVANTTGSAVRLVLSRRSCEYPAWEPSLALGVESTDGGYIECASADATTATGVCIGPAADYEAVTRVAYYVAFPNVGSGYSVCYRHGAMNWRMLSPSGMSVFQFFDENHPQPFSVLQRDAWGVGPGTSEIIPVSTTTSLDLSASVETRGGAEAMFLIRDSGAGLSLGPRRVCERGLQGCTSTGDVLRLAPAAQGCGITPQTWVPELAVTDLLMWCPKTGTGPGFSGLSSTPCTRTLYVQTLCASATGCTDTSPQLMTLASALPDYYDDIVPERQTHYGVSAAAAILRLPTYSPSGSNDYNVCYRRAQSWNWAVLHSFTVTPALELTLNSPVAGTTLVSGATQRVRVTLSESMMKNPTGAIRPTITAKFVAYNNTRVLDMCALAPLQTEAAVATTSSGRFLDADHKELEFFIPVPPTEGDISLCLQIVDDQGNGRSAWFRLGETYKPTYSVVESNLRWYVSEADVPTNTGMTTVHIVQCKSVVVEDIMTKACGAALNPSGVLFNTSVGGDAAKIVAAGEVCADDYGAHVDPIAVVPVGGTVYDGVTNLGPADGQSLETLFHVTLPSTPDDASVVYKVCLKTTLPGHDAQWYEVSMAFEAAGITAATIRDATGKNAFATLPALVGTWSVREALVPEASWYAAAAGVVTAGASTEYVVAGTTGNETVYTAEQGFVITFTTAGGAAYGASSAADTWAFKLVEARRPVSDMPYDVLDTAQWGDVGSWAALDGNCEAPAVAGTEVNLACPSGEVCPRITAGKDTSGRDIAAVSFQMPINPGTYLVCVDVGASRPWMVVPHAGGTYVLTVHPALLTAEVDADGANATFTDLAVVRGAPGSASISNAAGWCTGTNATCGGLATPYDLATTVVHTNVCPLPTAYIASGGTASGGYTWHPLSVAVDSAALRLGGSSTGSAFKLPLADSATTPAKLCVFKAREHGNDTSRVTRAGVMYHVRNSGPRATGGGSGVWYAEAARTAPTNLSVISTGLTYDTNFKFTEISQAPSFYENFFTNTTQVARTELLDPTTLHYSHTPYVDNTVNYEVRVVGADGTVATAGRMVVDVLRCKPAATFDALKCENLGLAEPGEEGAFELRGVGGRCSVADAGGYAWPRDALRQYTADGIARFTLHYESLCPRTAFGCGIRFRARAVSGDVLGTVPEAPLELLSNPFWVNTVPVVPDGLEINGAMVVPKYQPSTPSDVDVCTGVSRGSALRCYLMRCESGIPCVINFRAVSKGNPAIRPPGGLSVGFATFDYPGFQERRRRPPDSLYAVLGDTVTASLTVLDADWHAGGRQTATFTPVLTGTTDEELVFLNVSVRSDPVDVGTDALVFAYWARFVVKVARARMSVALPLSLETIPQPAGFAAVPPAPPVGSVFGTDYTVYPGSYLEALVPYRFAFQPVDRDGNEFANVPGVLAGVVVTGVVVGSTHTRVLRTHTRYEDNFITTVDRLRHYEWRPGAEVATFELVFRVYVADDACSRFNAQGGCLIEFAFSGSSSILPRIFIRTPVRVPASTLKITTATPVDAVPLREGVVTSVYPGTHVSVLGVAAGAPATRVFVPDEYHYGDVFVLIDSSSSSSSSALTDGTAHHHGAHVVPDAAAAIAGVCIFYKEQNMTRGCAVHKYPTQALNGTAWGARFILNMDRPCAHCGFTFHTTWGAGPEAYEADRPAGEAGRLVATFEEDEMAMVCSDALTVGWAVNATGSDSFAVNASAVLAGAPSTVMKHPVWEVILTASSAGAYRLYQYGGPVREPSTSLADGGVFAGLTVTGGAAPSSTEPIVMTLAMRAVVPQYTPPAGGDLAAAGGFARETGRLTLTCATTVTVELTPQPKFATRRGLKVLSAEGATALCGEGEEKYCNRFLATIDDLADGGVKFNFRFSTITEFSEVVNEFATLEPLALVPAGGAASTPTAAVQWAASGGVSVSDSIYLDSPHNTYPPFAHNGFNYTYGGLHLLAERYSPPENATAFEAGWVTLRYGAASTQFVDHTPVRQAVIRFCDVADPAAAVEVEGNTCVEVQLWVLPSAPVRSVAVLSASPSGAVRRGSAAACGSEAISFTCLPYFVVPTFASAARYILYDAPVEFSFRIGGTDGAGYQQLSFEGSSIRTSVLQKNNSVTTEMPLTHDLGIADFKVNATMYAQILMPAPAAVTVEAIALAQTHSIAHSYTSTVGVFPIAAAVTDEKYSFVDSDIAAEQQAQWLLRDAVLEDDECPAKRILASNVNNYRAFVDTGDVLAQNWTFGAGGVVGVPFPVQTAVQDFAGRRAWAFTDGVLVRVSKMSDFGCNDGGTIDVLALNPSGNAAEVAAMSGDREDSFTPAEGKQAVRIQGGLATPWVVFNDACDSCALRLDLCYTGRGVDDCLDMPDTPTASDVKPVRTDRTKYTKRFTIVPPKPDIVQVVAQDIPSVSAGVDMATADADALGKGVTAVRVGAPFRVQLGAAHLFAGKWAMRVPSDVLNKTHTLHVNVRSAFDVAVTVPGGVLQTGRVLRYGNGGFVGEAVGEVAGACEPGVSHELYTAARPSVALPVDPDGRVAFHFARPCSACAVHLEYKLMPAGGGLPLREGSFPLRHYDAAAALRVPTDVLALRVTTCGAGWIVVGVPQPMIRSRQPFAITLHLVDRNMHRAEAPTQAAAYTANLALRRDSIADDTSPAERELVITTPYAHVTPLPGMGNGGGGAGAVMTSPVVHVPAPRWGGPWLAPFAGEDAPRWVRGFNTSTALDWKDLDAHWPGDVRGGDGHETALSASDGAAVVRMTYPRACYHCGLVAGQRPDGRPNYVVHTVVTDATQILAMPKEAAGGNTVYTDARPTGVAEWAFDVYVADANSDRAYQAGGATEAAFIPRFYVPQYNAVAGPGAPGVLDVAVTGYEVSAIATDGAGRSVSLQLNPPVGNSTVSVGAGGTVLNGVPLDIAVADRPSNGFAPPGRATIRVEAPIMGVGVAFSLAEGTGTSYAALPTVLRRGRDDVVSAEAVALAIRTATHIAMGTPLAAAEAGDTPRCARRGNHRGRPCMLRVYAIAADRDDGVPPDDVSNDDDWYTAPVDSSVGVTLTCCEGSAQRERSKTVQFAGGVAEVRVDAPVPAELLAEAVCECTVAVAAPAALPRARGVSAVVEFAAAGDAGASWEMRGTSTLPIAGGRAASVQEQDVDLDFALIDPATGGVYDVYSGRGAPAWTDPATITVNADFVEPPGCFVCAATTDDGLCRVTPSQNGAIATLRGRFIRGNTQCALRTGALSGFPLASDATLTASILASLTVEVVAAARIEVHHGTDPTDPGVGGVFGLNARTWDGRPAGYAHEPVHLHFRVVTADGRLVANDFSSVVSLKGATLAGVPYAGALGPFTAVAGVVSVPITVAMPTRSAACEALGVASTQSNAAARQRIDGAGGCAHDPWVFNVTSATAGGASLGAVEGFGPIHIVRRAHTLLSFAAFDEKCGAVVPPALAPFARPARACVDLTTVPAADQLVTSLLDEGWRPLTPYRAGVDTADVFGMLDEVSVWAVDRSFAALLLAVDRFGAPVMHPEDAGSQAWLQLGDRGVPCHAVDAAYFGAYYAQTCLQAYGELPNPNPPCTFTPATDLSPCTAPYPRASPPVNAAGGVQLHGGMAVIPAVMIPPTQPGGFDGGFARFTWAPGRGWPQPAGAAAPASLAEVALERTVYMKVAVAGMDCRVAESGEDICRLPAEPVVRPEALLSYDVVLLTGSGKLATYDSTSEIELRGTCVTKEKAYLAVVPGNVTQRDAWDFVRPPVFTAERGVVRVRQVLVSRACKQMQLRFACRSPGGCGTLATTLEFPAVLGEVQTYIPLPREAHDTVDVQGLILEPASAQRVGLERVRNADVPALETAMRNLLSASTIDIVDEIVVRALCVLPAVNGARIITADERKNASACYVPGSMIPRTPPPTPAPPTLVPPTLAPENVTTQVATGMPETLVPATNAPPGVSDTNATATENMTETTNATDNAGTDNRYAQALQATDSELYVYAFIQVVAAAPIDPEAMSVGVREAIEADVGLGAASELRKAGWVGPSVKSMDVGIPGTPEPVTPGPPTAIPLTRVPKTPAPPTPLPPTAIPGTLSPARIESGGRTTPAGALLALMLCIVAAVAGEL